ncbi:helix-hairpin-helix domain-containing protein [Leifsonia sp. NPDC058248]|uniref:helix-hairpin-helix domain-containing protein n=1 Tax=Leifsonia sp. NPDC058248 TaxID=3346402 RepID=UPI0036DB17D0
MRHGVDAGAGSAASAVGAAPDAVAGPRRDADAGLTLEPRARSARVRIGLGAGVVLVIVALVAAVLFNAFGQRGSATELARPSSVPETDGAKGVDGPRTELLVHVLGAVKRPGLVSLATGSRVVDAVASAGGLADDAEVAGINLARPVADGEQLVVPKVGEVPPPAPGGTATGGAAGAGGAGAGGAARGALVNLNTATQVEFETLPRIGPALAQRIIDWRAANGRFSAPADLLKVTGIGQKLFDGLSDRITV